MAKNIFLFGCGSATLGIERRKFHREIKPIIVSDFKNELQKFKVENPDIGLDENDNIYFLDPKRPFKND